MVLKGMSLEYSIKMKNVSSNNMCALKNTTKDELIAIVKKLDKKAKKYKKTNRSRLSNQTLDTKIDKNTKKDQSQRTKIKKDER